MKKQSKAQVAIIMGSRSDWPYMKEASQLLKEFKIPHLCEIVSAHRTPSKLKKFCESARDEGLKVIIAGAGGAAHLPGMAAAFTELPVIGVPVPQGNLKGLDALLSIAQMPKGVPVACVSIGNSWNAALLAIQILGGENLNAVKKLKKKMELKVLKSRIK